MHGGADATGQSAIANDATTPTHRRRNPGESLHGGPPLPEPAIPPVAVGHEHEPTAFYEIPDDVDAGVSSRMENGRSYIDLAITFISS
jgi:hypothetical protein